MKIIQLNKETEIYVPKLVELYHLEVPKLMGSYAPEDLDIFIKKRDSNYFKDLANKRDIGQRRAATLLTDDFGDLEGVLESSDTFARVHVAEILWILTSKKGKGNGTLLLNYFIGKAKRENCDLICLSVAKRNEGAIRLYERTGFSHLSDRSDLKTPMAVYCYPLSEKGTAVLEA